MTETETVKALECCGDESNCAECPLKGTRFELDHSCAEELMKVAAELIKSKNAKIKELQHKISSCNSEIDKLKSKLPQGFEQADPMDFCGLLCDFAEELIEKAKTEARKEFAERLKELPSVTNCEYEWFHLDIDNLLKEMEVQR